MAFLKFLVNRVILSASSVFGSVVVVVFLSIFHAEIYQNEIFLFFKNYF